MLYTAYRNGILYNSQNLIALPKGDNGIGSMSFLLSSNRNKAVEFIKDTNISISQSLTKRYLTDSMYKWKFGTKMITLLERNSNDRYFKDLKNFPISYINNSVRTSVLGKGYNVVNDLSRWMELFFANTMNLSPKKKCEGFIDLFSTLYTSNEYSNYNTKLMIFDVDSWVASAKACVMMNSKLLNNPLSILIYASRQYPELMDKIPNIRFMIVSRNSKQVIFYDTSFITRENYSSIKGKLGQFKSIIFSTDDEVNPSINDMDAEVNATIANNIKKEIVNKIKYSILGINYEEVDDSDVDDITREIIEDESLSDENEETLIADAMNIENLDGEIGAMVDAELEKLGDMEAIVIDEVADKVTDDLSQKIFKTSFVPERTPEEEAKINRLLEGQDLVLKKYTKEEVDSNTIKISELGSLIGIDNPNLQNSKFMNFDQDYVEKKLERNIDDAVRILSTADHKIFITNKEVVDSSTPLDLKKTYIYSMIDEKGNKMTIKFDVPTIMDGSYIYINGTKKIIGHQFILKPLVKTDSNTVQLVTAYNKVFIRRHGRVTQSISNMTTFLEKNKVTYKVTPGICDRLNEDFDPPIDHIMLSKSFLSFTIGDIEFNMNINKNIAAYERNRGKKLNYNSANEIPVGYNTKTKEVVMMNRSDSFTELLYNSFTPEAHKALSKIKRKPKLISAKAKMMGKDIPLILFMMFCVGFTKTMEIANIEYHFISKDTDKKELDKFDVLNWDLIEIADGYIAWKKTPFRNELLMNGLKESNLGVFLREELDSKETYISLVSNYYPGNSRIGSALDNYKDFLLDFKSQEILEQLGYPSQLVPLLTVAAGMLTDNSYNSENSMKNMRIRSSEVIADIVNIKVTEAYREYRNTAYKKKPTAVSMKQTAVIDSLLSSQVNLVEENSPMNPILEIEKKRAVTYKGLRGNNKDRAMTLSKRAYDATMLGTIGITTSPDSNVGIVRQLTMEPQVTSTYGYIDTSKSEDLDSLNNTNLFTVGELINPFGITHNDPDRSAMSYKQTKYMIPVKEGDPVLFGNKVEQVIPYLASSEFIITAKENGKVIEKTKDYCIVEYESGVKYAIDISTQIKKNSSQGTWIDNTFLCKLEVGDTVKMGEVLAYNPHHFTPNAEGEGASMNVGALAKVAITSFWDIYEDSAPISKNLSNKLTTEVVDEKAVTLSKYAIVDNMVKIGDKIKAGETLLRFLEAGDENIGAFLDDLREGSQNEIIESAKTTISSKYTGVVSDIRIYTTVETDELSPSLKDIVNKYQAKIKKRNKVLDKHQNENDQAYYKAGQVITETPDVIEVGKNGKVKGQIMGPDSQVVILIYIKYELGVSKGDKTVISVCKGICSHVYEEGMEPFSEFRPEEVIDSVVAPLAVSARKVPEILMTLFMNKVLIEAKRGLQKIYEE